MKDQNVKLYAISPDPQNLLTRMSKLTLRVIRGVDPRTDTVGVWGSTRGPRL
jgi:hypothetical protein